MRSAVVRPLDPETPRAMLEAWTRSGRERTLALIYQLTGEHSAACEDILQDVSLRAHRAVAQFRGEASFETWLTTIVLRECQRYRRKRALWRSARQWLLAPTHAESVNELKTDTLLRNRIFDALDRLTPSQREVFVLVHLQEMTVADAAAALGCATGTAKSHLHRALERLRRSLRASYGED